METNNNPNSNNNSQGGNGQNINDSAIAYMENKYGEKFEYAGAWGNSMSTTHELLVTCGSFPGQQILVQIENYRDDNKVFLDNYLAVKYKDETFAFFKNCASRTFGDAKVFYDVVMNGLSAQLPASASFNEYIADTRVLLPVMVGVKKSSFSTKENAESVGNLAAEKGTNFILSIVFVDDEEYETINESALGDAVVFGKYKNVQLTNQGGNDLQVEWREEN